MNKMFLACVSAMVAGVAFSEVKPPRGTERILAEQKAIAERRAAAEAAAEKKGPRRPKGGGRVMRRLPGGAFVFADARKSAVGRSFSDVIEQMQIFCKIPVEWRKVAMEGKNPIDLAKSIIVDKTIAGATSVIYNGGIDDPVLVALPENGIALVNVTPLYANVDASQGDDRLEKELWRAVCFAAGGTDAECECVLKTVTKPSDLDKIDCKMANPGATGSVGDNASKFGLGRIQIAPYWIACKEGWAPAPTNEQQKAFWDKANAIRKLEMKDAEPTDPFTIKFKGKKTEK